MKLLVTNLYSRPYVRRGGKTLLEEISLFLAKEGNEVTVLTTKPGKALTETVNGVHYIRLAQPPRFLRRFANLQEVVFAAQCFQHMLRVRYDLIHCLHYSDSCGAWLAGLATKVPYLYYNLGIPVWRFYLRRPVDFVLLNFAVRGARQNLTVSRFAADHLQEGFGLRATVLEPPCDLEKFHADSQRDLQSPVFLAVGAFSETRKGLNVLLEAFALVKKQLPNSRLVISGQVDQPRLERLLRELPEETRDSVEAKGVGALEDLPKLYAGAAVTVLPSMWEAFGLVLVESLASGTPVVGTRHGGIPEIISPDVGVLFEPNTLGLETRNAKELASAMLQVLQLHADPHIAARCRAAAQRFSWSSFAEKLKNIHAAAIVQESPR